MSFSLLSFQTILAGSTISPIDSHEAMLGPMTYPSVVQVSVDVHAVSQWSYLCLGRMPACESRSLLDGGAFHSLCGGLALSWRWVGELFNGGFLKPLIISLCVSRLPVKETAHFRTGCRLE